MRTKKNESRDEEVPHKPAVAYSSEDKAKRNIEAKLDALSYILDLCVESQENAKKVFEAVEKDDGDAILLPKSQRQFLIWSDISLLKSLGYQGEGFRRTGNGTLNRYTTLHSQVEELTSNLWKELQTQRERRAESTESQLRKALKRERMRTATLERDIIELRRQLQNESEERIAAQEKLKEFGRQYGHIILREGKKESAKVLSLEKAGRGDGKR
ncbi:hypothetical protein [Cupriavidus sp. WS]|uniref:hypothetical protein n=1 Tax=Cupriavidus sp. WS TaxID=1312922 RepID=UPI0012DD38B4|nr:hypothetical protein [Cupriavidus sp. WS]